MYRCCHPQIGLEVRDDVYWECGAPRASVRAPEFRPLVDRAFEMFTDTRVASRKLFLQLPSKNCIKLCLHALFGPATGAQVEGSAVEITQLPTHVGVVQERHYGVFSDPNVAKFVLLGIATDIPLSSHLG